MNYLITILSGLAVAVLGAFALSTVWGWFMVPVGLPAISMLTAYGAMLVITCLFTPLACVLVAHQQPNLDSSTRTIATQIGMSVGYVSVLIFGFLVISLFG